MTTIKRRSRRQRQEADPALMRLLRDEPPAADDFRWQYTKDVIAQAWREHGDRITEEWAAQYPGTRPSLWWKFDAPRAQDVGRHAGWYCAGEMIEYRRKLTGGGHPLWDSLAYGPHYHYGIADWFGDRTATFETQHAYLLRHGLLFDDEGEPIPEPHVVPSLSMVE